MMSAVIFSAVPVSPPDRVTVNRLASRRSPARKSFTHLCGSFGGSANERKQAKGSPPIEAMSLNPRARQRCPTLAAGCHSRRKWIFSMHKSVVTSRCEPAGTFNMAQSSPIPRTTPGLTVLADFRRITSIICFSGMTNRSNYIEKIDLRSISLFRDNPGAMAQVPNFQVNYRRPSLSGASIPALTELECPW